MPGPKTSGARYSIRDVLLKGLFSRGDRIVLRAVAVWVEKGLSITRWTVV